MGVPIKDPNTPPFEIVNVPPAISSGVILLFFPFYAKFISSLSISAKSIDSQFLNTGTKRPFGVATATEISTKSL